jgi:hypothetical protein
MNTAATSGKQHANYWPIVFLLGIALFGPKVWTMLYTDYANQGIEEPDKGAVRRKDGKVEKGHSSPLRTPTEAERLAEEWIKRFDTPPSGLDAPNTSKVFQPSKVSFDRIH